MRNRWIKANGIVWEELGAEALVVSPSSRTSWILNPVATFIWKHCNGATSLNELARAFARRSGRKLSLIERELSEFCHNLATIGLLETAMQPGVSAGQVACFGADYVLPSMTGRSLGNTGRRRASPRGNSGPG